MMFCDACGDIVTVVYPLTLRFHDKIEITLKICFSCYHNNETLEINVKRKHKVAKMMAEFKNKPKSGVKA